VTHENPHHAAMITDGMFYTGALKSRQSLHMTADLDPTEVKDHINNHPLKHLNKDGTDSGNPVDTIKGDVHIARTYGERYQWREGVDFNYGLNATYNFGQQYVENHADELTADAEVFAIPGLDSADSSAAGSADDALQAGLADEQKAGLVSKSFGNQYIYDQGITRTWAKGPGACIEHVTLNFGGRYIENQLTKDSGDQDTSGLNGLVSDTTLAIKTVGDEARYNEGVIDIHHEGDMKHIQTGAHTSEITGDVTETITGNVTKDVTGDVTQTITGGKYEVNQTLSGDSNQIIMAGGKMSIQATAGTEISSIEITPSKKSTISGNEDWIKTAMKSEMVVGMVNENFIGGKFSTIGGLITENALGAKVSTHSGPIMENKQGQIGKNQLSIQDIKSVCMDKSMTKIQKASLILIG